MFGIRGRRNPQSAFQQKYSEDFFFQDITGKNFIGNGQEKSGSSLGQNFPPIAHGQLAQVGRIPYVRFDFFLEEPVHALIMFSRSAVPLHTPTLSAESGGS